MAGKGNGKIDVSNKRKEKMTEREDDRRRKEGKKLDEKQGRYTATV